MASSLINVMANRWQTVETVTDFIFLGSKIAADGDCSHEIKRCLLLGGKKKKKNPRQDIIKHRHYFVTKVHLRKSYDFPSSHTCLWQPLKKAEHRKIDVFELWCWRLLRVPWTARRSNQSMLKEISPGYSLEWLMLKLKLNLQYFDHLMWKTDSLEKDSDAGNYWRWGEKGTTGEEMVGWHH